jgi:hypothetical protein
VKIDYDGLKTALAALSAGHATHADLLTVVRISRAIVEAYLKFRAPSLGYLYRNQGLSETDLAYDCIAEVFRSEDGRRYPKLLSFASALNVPVDETPAVELFIALRGFLVRIARAHLAGLFYLADPAGGRIHRNIRDCVKQHAGLRLVDTASGIYLAASPDRPAAEGGAFPPEELERELLARAGRDRSTASLLGHVHRLLSEDLRFGGRVRLFDVVVIFRRMFDSDHLAELSDPDPAFGGLSESDVLVLRDRCLDSVKAKIFLTYLGKGKLARREATALYDAVADVIGGWMAGSDGDISLAERLRAHMDFTPQDYAERYRAKLEYLVKSARAELAAMLMGDL